MPRIDVSDQRGAPKKRMPQPGEIWLRTNGVMQHLMLITGVREIVDGPSKETVIDYFNLGNKEINSMNFPQFYANFEFGSDNIVITLK